MLKPFRWILPVFILSLPMTACLSTLMGTKETRSSRYQIPDPGAEWQRIDPGQADRAWRNSQDQAVLNVTSVCGESAHKPLEELSKDILRQLPEQEPVEPARPATVSGHPALITEARGQVDGKPLHVRLAVIRTPSCLFDIILAGPKLEPGSRLAFDRSLEGFQESRVR